MTGVASRTTVAGGVTIAAASVAVSVVQVVGAWVAPWVALFWLLPSLGCVAGLLDW